MSVVCSSNDGTVSGRVLVVDDDRAIRGLVQVLIERRGFSVDAAADGNEAHALLVANVYDAILLDLMMPNLNGFDLIERLRREQPSILSRVIVLTAFSRRGRVPLIEGVHAVVRKPFDLDELIPVVHDCVATERVQPNHEGGLALEPDALAKADGKEFLQ